MKKKNSSIISQKTIIFSIILSFGIIPMFAQIGRTVKGTVVDPDSQPLIGVFVKEAKSSNGAVTDFDGSYEISLTTENAQLSFSYVGYVTQTKKVADASQLNIVMADDALNLNEVVVVGYGGTISREKLTASISKVSGAPIEKGITQNPISALAGNATGVRVTQMSGQPGTAPEIIIRGGTSYKGTGTPLYIVDGMQRKDLGDVNTKDIESIEIMKDAAATALYGARANNGVVLITTKGGRSGKTELSLEINVGRNFYRDNNKFLNAHDFLYWTRVGTRRSNMPQLLTNAGPFGTGNILSANGNVSNQGQYSTMYKSAVDEATWTRLQSEGWQMMADPVWDGIDANKQYLIFKEFQLKDDNIQEAWSQNYNLSMTGGNDKGKYYSSLSFLTEDGFPAESAYKRVTFTLNGEYKIKPWLEGKAFVNFSKSDVNKNPITNDLNFFGRMFSAPPTIRQYNNDGELILTAANFTDGNIAAQSHLFHRRNETFKTSIGSSAKMDFTKNLSLTLKGMWDLYFNEQEFFNKKYLKSPGIYDETRKASISYARYLNETYNAVLNFKQDFGLHSISALGGYEYITMYDYGISASGEGATSDDFINIDYVVKGDLEKYPLSLGTTHVKERMMSGFVNINYDYDNRYLLSFFGRLDGYSKLIDNRWGFFPGVSAGWNIYREDFMKDFSQINNLKFRVGVGQTGNVGIVKEPYELQGSYAQPGNYKGDYAFLIHQLPYPKLKWEKTTSFDIAFDFALFDQLSGSVGYYNKHTSDVLASVYFPTSAGVGTMKTNNGSVRQNGLELELKWQIFKTKDFEWDLGGTFTYQRSKVLSLPDNGNVRNFQDAREVWDPKNPGQLMWVDGVQEGQEYGAIYSYKATHIVRDENDLLNYADYIDTYPDKSIYGPAAYEKLSDAEKKNVQQLAPGDVIWKDVNGDNIIDRHDQVKIGNRIPRVLGGFNTSVTWKNFNFYAQFDFAAGYKQHNNRLSWYLGMKQGTYNTVDKVWETWGPNNVDAKYPIYQYADQLYKQNYRESSLFYENSSYICARNMTLSYNVPKAIVEKINLGSLSISATGQNLFYLTPSNLYSPEYGANQDGGYPLPISVLLGIKANF